MNGQIPLAGTAPQQPASSEPQWAAHMLLVVQAIQRLHAAFDQKFVHPKNLP